MWRSRPIWPGNCRRTLSRVFRPPTFFEPKNFTFPFGTHIVAVEIDRETGDIKFLRYVAVDDCGKVINPMLVDGQLHGGIVQSIGQALLRRSRLRRAGPVDNGHVDGLCRAPRPRRFPGLSLIAPRRLRQLIRWE